MPEPTPKRRGGNPAMVKGGPSLNPRGRPRAGLALAERIRERIDPDLVIDLAVQLANDTTVPVERRLAALLPFVQLGYLKPPTTIAARIEQTNGPQRDLSAIPLEMRRAMLEALRAAPRIANPDDDVQSNG